MNAEVLLVHFQYLTVWIFSCLYLFLFMTGFKSIFAFLYWVYLFHLNKWNEFFIKIFFIREKKKPKKNRSWFLLKYLLPRMKIGAGNWELLLILEMSHVKWYWAEKIRQMACRKCSLWWLNEISFALEMLKFSNHFLPQLTTDCSFFFFFLRAVPSFTLLGLSGYEDEKFTCYHFLCLHLCKDTKN